MTLHVGQRVTLLTIDNTLAMSHRRELEVRSVLEPKPTGYQNTRTRLATVRQHGKRRECYLDLTGDDILLDGWDLPLRTDTEGKGGMSGNACFNLIGDAAAIRQCLETRAARPISDEAKAKVFVTPAERTTRDDSGRQLLYPEIETHHAVVNRFKEARRIADPTYTPTVEEALRHPEAFMDGFTEL
jgi:hypothetical protein